MRIIKLPLYDQKGEFVWVPVDRLIYITENRAQKHCLLQLDGDESNYFKIALTVHDLIRLIEGP